MTTSFEATTAISMMDKAIAVLGILVDGIFLVWRLMVVAIYLVPTGYLLLSGYSDRELGTASGLMLAALWLAFASALHTCLNTAGKVERWANRR